MSFLQQSSYWTMADNGAISNRFNFKVVDFQRMASCAKARINKKMYRFVIWPEMTRFARARLSTVLWLAVVTVERSVAGSRPTSGMTGARRVPRVTWHEFTHLKTNRVINIWASTPSLMKKWLNELWYYSTQRHQRLLINRNQKQL